MSEVPIQIVTDNDQGVSRLMRVPVVVLEDESCIKNTVVLGSRFLDLLKLRITNRGENVLGTYENSKGEEVAFDAKVHRWIESVLKIYVRRDLKGILSSYLFNPQRDLLFEKNEICGIKRDLPRRSIVSRHHFYILFILVTHLQFYP